MSALKIAMTVQAIVTLVYGLPTLLAPDWWTAVTQQPALPESYIPPCRRYLVRHAGVA
jgi:hypothetical protein